MVETTLNNSVTVGAGAAEDITQAALDLIKYEIVPTNLGNAISKAKQSCTFKLIVIGNSGVGKSCLMHRVTTNEFSEDHEVTIGVEFGTMLLKMQESLIKLQIWDTAG